MRSPVERAAQTWPSALKLSGDCPRRMRSVMRAFSGRTSGREVSVWGQMTLMPMASASGMMMGPPAESE